MKSGSISFGHPQRHWVTWCKNEGNMGKEHYIDIESNHNEFPKNTSITAIGITVVLLLKKAIQTILAMATILMNHGICLRTKSQLLDTHVELKILHEQNPY